MDNIQNVLLAISILCVDYAIRREGEGFRKIIFPIIILITLSCILAFMR
jgi:hypothetical protein